MFEQEKIILALIDGPDVNYNIDKYFNKYSVEGIVTSDVDCTRKKIDRTVEFIIDYDNVCMYVYTKKIVVVDDFWQTDMHRTFKGIMENMGLRLGEDYIFEKLQLGKVDTNLVWNVVNKEPSIFENLMQKIIGDRKFVIVHGNCQTHVISNMLGQCKGFVTKYITCVMPEIWMEGAKEFFEIMLESKVFDFADYLFTQDISDENRFGKEFATNNLKLLVPESCEIFLISNLFFMGYYPQYRKIDISPDANLLRGKILDATEYVDKNVLHMIAEGLSDEEIISSISDLMYYKRDILLEGINKELDAFEERECGLDIKMSDYLKEHILDDLLFATSNHPTKVVLLELAKRILQVLGVEDNKIECTDEEIQSPMPSNWRYIVYPSVLNQLNIKRQDTYTFKAFLTEKQLKLIPEDKLKECITGRNAVGEYLVEVQGDFELYMRIYVRCLKASMMLL